MKEKIEKLIKFIKESYYELKKVSWLSKKEVIASTFLVVMIILIFAVYIGTVDFILSKIVGFILGGRV